MSVFFEHEQSIEEGEGHVPSEDFAAEHVLGASGVMPRAPTAVGGVEHRLLTEELKVTGVACGKAVAALAVYL